MTVGLREFLPGSVALVGGGPGDPDLLTQRAVRRLACADVVFYDALVNPDVLEIAAGAQRVFVGKRAGRPALRQSTINQLLVRAARRGRRVVRLKGGDPFVFGRGAEEGLALLAAGVPFEVVPGITSAVAAAELAGIPVTHRGTAAAFVVVSGHAPAGYEPVLATLAPHSATVVVLMGLGSSASIATLMIERGWKANTPAAVVRGASTATGETWTGALGELGTAVQSSGSDLPGTLVIGDVVRIGALLGGQAAAGVLGEDVSAVAAR